MAKAPEQINLMYRKVGDVHIFASKGIKGLVHVGHENLKTAYDNVLIALHVHVLETYGIEAHYKPVSDFDEFEQKTTGFPGNVFPVKLDAPQVACH